MNKQGFTVIVCRISIINPVRVNYRPGTRRLPGIPLLHFSFDFCYLAEICEVETRGCSADTPTLSLSCKQTVFIHLGGPNRLCLSFRCVRRRRCDMSPWKRGGMPLAAALGAFHHIQRNNKHNNVGGGREYFMKKKEGEEEEGIRSPLN